MCFKRLQKSIGLYLYKITHNFLCNSDNLLSSIGTLKSNAQSLIDFFQSCNKVGPFDAHHAKLCALQVLEVAVKLCFRYSGRQLNLPLVLESVSH